MLELRSAGRPCCAAVTLLPCRAWASVVTFTGRASMSWCHAVLPPRLAPQALFATGAQAPPGHWERIAGCLDPTEAQRTTLRHMWRNFAAQLQAIR